MVGRGRGRGGGGATLPVAVRMQGDAARGAAATPPHKIMRYIGVQRTAGGLGLTTPSTVGSSEALARRTRLTGPRLTVLSTPRPAPLEGEAASPPPPRLVPLPALARVLTPLEPAAGSTLTSLPFTVDMSASGAAAKSPPHCRSRLPVSRGFSQFCRRPTIWAAVFVGAFFILWVVFANPTKLATARKGDANFVGKQKIRQKWPTEPTNTLSVSIPYFVGGRQSWEMSPPILSAGRQNRGFDKTAKTPYLNTSP